VQSNLITFAHTLGATQVTLPSRLQSSARTRLPAASFRESEGWDGDSDVVKSLVARTFSLQFFVAVKSRLLHLPRVVDKSEISWSLIEKRFGKGDENFSFNLWYTTGLKPFRVGYFLDEL
jgi:hypothetical protein